MIGDRADMYDAKKHFYGSRMSLSVTVTSSFDSLELMILQCDFNRRELLIRQFVTFFSCAFCLSSAFSPQAEYKALQKRQANRLRLGDGLHDDLAEELVETTPKLGQKKKAANPPGPTWCRCGTTSFSLTANMSSYASGSAFVDHVHQKDTKEYLLGAF